MGPMRRELDLAIPADPRLLRRTRQEVSTYLDELGIDHAASCDVVLAIDEACVNIIRHAYAEPPPDPAMHVSARLDSQELVVEVEDRGIGFRPLPTGFELPPAGALSGRGLGLMRRLMTSVDIGPGPGARGTTVRMRKSLSSTTRRG